MTSPESTPDRRSYSPEERQVLTIDAVDEWREHQKKMLYEERLKAIADGRELTDTSYIDDFNAKNDENLDSFLAEKGIDTDHPGLQDVKETYKSASIDTIHDNEWYSSPHARGEGDNTVSERDRINAELTERLASEDLPDDEIESNRVLSPETRAQVDAARKKFAKEISDRTKKAGLFEARGSVAERQNAKEELADLIGAAATEMMDELETYDLSKEEIAIQIEEFVQSQMALMLADIEESRTADFHNRSKFTQKALAKWASWKAPEGASFRERVFTVNNLKKGLVFAVPGAVFGATVGLVGGGVLAGGAAVLLARSIARNLAGVKLDNAADATTLAAEQASELQQRMEASASKVHHDLLELADLQAAEIHHHNRNRIIGGTAISLATAGLFSGVVSALGSELMFGKVGEGVKAVGNIPRPSDVDGGISAPSEGIPQTGGESDHFNRMTEAAKVATDRAVRLSAHENAIESYVDNHDSGVDVNKGEGWYHTFKEFGITGSKQDDLLREIGPELEKMGEAYRMEDGLWGISRPGDLSDEASKLIVDTANEHGWLKDGLDNVSPTTPEVPEALSEVKPGEGILQTLQDAGVENPTLEDVTAVQDQLVDTGAAYADGPGGYAGLNLPENGTMNDAGINTVMDYADNKQLDNSVNTVNVAGHMVGQGENAVDYQQLEGVEQAGNDHLTYLETTELNNDIHEMSDMLNVGSRDALNENISKLNANADYQNALQYIQQDLKGLTYPGTDTLVIEPTYAIGGQQWKFNPVPPDSYMPVKAVNTLVAYEQSRFALAS